MPSRAQTTTVLRLGGGTAYLSGAVATIGLLSSGSPALPSRFGDRLAQRRRRHDPVRPDRETDDIAAWTTDIALIAIGAAAGLVA